MKQKTNSIKKTKNKGDVQKIDFYEKMMIGCYLIGHVILV